MTLLLRSLSVLLCLIATAPLGAQNVEVSAEGVVDPSTDVLTISFTSDAHRLLASTREGDLILLTLPEGSPQRPTRVHSGDRGPAILVSFLAGDTAIVSGHTDGSILVFSLSELEDEGEPQPVHRLAASSSVTHMALDAGRRILAVATEGGEVELFDLLAGQRLGAIDARGELDDLLHLGFDRPGRQLLAVNRNGNVTAWDPSTLRPLRHLRLQGEEFHGSRSVIHSVGADRSANILVVALEEVALPRGGLRGQARPGDLERRDQLLVFDWHSGAHIRGVGVPEGVIDHLAVGPGNDHAVVARGRHVNVMDLRAGTRGAGFEAPGGVHAMALAPDDGRLAVATDEGIALWSMTYRAQPSVGDLDAVTQGISGRLRILGEDSPAVEAPDDGARPVLAILPFADRQGDEQMSALVAELLTTQLANVEHLRLVERLRIDDILAEQDLRRQGLTEAHGLELGRILNADLILLGSVGAFGTSQMLSASILDVETGEVLSGRQVVCEECRAQDFFDAVHLLGTAIAR